MDRFDWVAVAGFLSLVGLSTRVDAPVLAAALGGFLLSLAGWRLYDGRPWEALGWLAWVGAAIALVVTPGSAIFWPVFLGSLLAGTCLLFGDRFGLFPDLWSADADVVE